MPLNAQNRETRQERDGGEQWERLWWETRSVRTPPCDSPRNARAAVLGLPSCRKLTRHRGAPAPLAGVCRLREAGGLGAGSERMWAGDPAWPPNSATQGEERAPTRIADPKLSEPGARAGDQGHPGAVSPQRSVHEGGVAPFPFQVRAQEGAGIPEGSRRDARGRLAGGGRPSD